MADPLETAFKLVTKVISLILFGLVSIVFFPLFLIVGAFHQYIWEKWFDKIKEY